MSDYTNLGIQKQDTLIRATNGSNAARELYTDPATLILATYAPNFEAVILGEFVYKVEYEFSGMKAPGLLIPPPMPIPQPQNIVPVPQQIVVPQTPEEKLASEIALLKLNYR
jgi:hypothetical protein